MTPSPRSKASSEQAAGGLIGFGAVAEKAHAPAWLAQSDCRIAAVAEAAAARRRAAKALFPQARLYADHREMLAAEKNLDFVDIATPPFLHARQAEDALARGLHVLCEKPLVMSGGEFAALKARAAKHGLALFATHNWKYAPLLQKLRALLDAGAVGALRHAEWHVLRTRPSVTAPKAGANWRTDNKKSGGGILMDHGWHAIYLLSWLLGDAPLSAAGALRRPSATAAEDEATALLTFSKATALFHLTWGAPTRGHWGVFYGEAGRIALHDDRLVVYPGGSEGPTYVFPEALSAGSAHPEWFAAMLADFRAAMQSPKHRAQNLEEAEACIRMIESLYGAGTGERTRRAHG